MVLEDVTVKHKLWSPSVVSPVPWVKGRIRTNTLTASPSPLGDGKENRFQYMLIRTLPKTSHKGAL